MGETFEAWTAAIATSAMTDPDAAAVAISLAPRDWLKEVFRRWGPLSNDDLAEVAQIERAQLAPLVVRRLLELLSPVPTPGATIRTCRYGSMKTWASS